MFNKPNQSTKIMKDNYQSNKFIYNNNCFLHNNNYNNINCNLNSRVKTKLCNQIKWIYPNFLNFKLIKTTMNLWKRVSKLINLEMLVIKIAQQSQVKPHKTNIILMSISNSQTLIKNNNRKKSNKNNLQ